MLISMKIEKLFEIFDYDIEFKTEGVTILTGPNGYGKTTVLKILDALASKNMFFFSRLLFEIIILNLSNGSTIKLKRLAKGEIEITVNKLKPTRWNSKSLEQLAESLPFFQRMGKSRWRDRRTGELLDSDALQQRISLEFPDGEGERLTLFPEIGGEFRNTWSKQIEIPAVYFIREQRLLRPVSSNKMGSKQRRFDSHSYEFNEEDMSVFSNTVEEYAKELRESIQNTLAKSSQITQKLDSSFPRRLFDQANGISEEEFKQRFDVVKEIQKALGEYEISDIKEDTHPTYKEENAKALHVYINDAEQKLAVFSELLDKLKAFTNILNERRFTFKRIAISKEEGFKFTTEQGKSLALSDLSSGEQQEVVLLYELLFKVKAGTLVLIDEPELSLHVVWQKQFLDDLFKIIALQKINIVIATHSPQIINNHWDLTIDLEDLRNAEASK
ncbi:MAG: AAA family ATPase [Gallionella sp.]|nr:AAA family ATPase [Gallionella sp.]